MGKNRSGNAVIQFCEKIEWQPKTVIIAGVGVRGTEVELMRQAWDDCEIYGFEPNPLTYQSWVRRESTFPGMLINSALGAFEGLATLRFRPQHKDGGSLAGLAEGPSASATVDVATLNSFFRRFEKAQGLEECLLWLDCEGSEHRILQGLIGEGFEKKIPVINVEMTGIPPADGWAEPVQIHTWMRDFGYHRRWVHTTRINRAQYDAIYVRNDRNFNPRIRMW